MSYAQGSIRDYWDAQGQPRKFKYSAKDYETMYIPYVIQDITVRDCSKEDIKNLRYQFPINRYTNDGLFIGKKGTAVDIDITYKCNMSCPNCNRAAHLHSLNKHTNVDLNYIKEFIAKYKDKIDIVKLVGGEPTLHPSLDLFIVALQEAGFIVWVLTNGVIDYQFPNNVYVENSDKVRDANPMFHATYMAPIDDAKFDSEDYSVGCSMLECGYGYSHDNKIHPCSVGMAISRLNKDELHQGFDSLNSMEQGTRQYLQQQCQYCGMFKKLGYHSVDKSDFGRTDINTYSQFWNFLAGVK